MSETDRRCPWKAVRQFTLLEYVILGMQFFFFHCMLCSSDCDSVFLFCFVSFLSIVVSTLISDGFAYLMSYLALGKSLKLLEC